MLRFLHPDKKSLVFDHEVLHIDVWFASGYVEPRYSLRVWGGGGNYRQYTRVGHLNEMVKGDYLRVRVEVDVTKPIYQGHRAVQNDEEEI